MAQHYISRYNCYNTRMKILYVITSTDVGGAENALVSLVKALSPLHTLRIVSLKPLGELAKQLPQNSVVSLEMTGAGLGCVSKLKREIESFKPDIVHAMLFRAIEFSRLACAGQNLKLITTPHFDLSQKPLWMRWLDRSLKSIDTLSTAESVSTYNYLLDHQHYAKQKTVLIANSVKKSLFFKDNSIRERMRAENGFSEQDVIFMSVARLAAVKNPLTTLRAFEKILLTCPHAKLVFVGEGGERKKLEAFITEKGLKNNVFLVGFQQNINDWLNMADVFVLLSKEESLPLALLEAKQVGLPCLVSRVGDMPAQIKHGEMGFVCNPQDEVVISCLLTELYEGKKLRQKMGENNLNSMAQAPDCSQQYQQLYQQIMGK